MAIIGSSSTTKAIHRCGDIFTSLRAVILAVNHSRRLSNFDHNRN
jgi:hypothetical protein